MTEYWINGEMLTKRKLITIKGSMVTTETGIPLMLNTNLPGVKIAGADVRLAKLDGTPIAREIECIDVPNTNDVTIHYPFDTVSGEDSQFYVYWGNSALSEPAASSTYGSEAVWDINYIAVYHFNQEPNGGGAGSILDSTGNYDATPVNYITNSLSNAAYGKQVTFDGLYDGNYLTWGYATIPANYTAEAYVNFDNTTPEYSDDLVTIYEGAADFFVLSMNNGSDIKWHHRRTGDTTRRQRTTDDPITKLVDSYLVLKHSSDADVDVFLDDVENTTRADDTVDDWTTITSIGGQQPGSRNHYFEGKYLEFRFSNIERSAGHSTSTHNNLNNPTSSGTDPFYLDRYDDSELYFAKSDITSTISSFLRRTPININRTGALSDCRTKVVSAYHTLMNIDFSDVRFNTQANGNGAWIPYWIESKTDGVTADIWVDYDLADGNNLIYRFYGNSALTSESATLTNTDSTATVTINNTTAPEKYATVSDSTGNVSVFERRKPIKLTHTGALTDYQKLLTITYEPAMLNNFKDIRFVTLDGTHIPHWIESSTDGSTADVWIKCDYDSGDTYVWIYYGNSDLSSGSNIDDTFVFGDDFPGSSIDGTKWENDTGVSVSGGIATCAADSMNTVADFSDPVITESLRRFTGASSGSVVSLGFGVDTTTCNKAYIASTNLLLKRVSGSNYDVTTNWVQNSYLTQKIMWDGATPNTEFEEDEVARTGSPSTTAAPTVDLPLYVQSTGSGVVYLDWIFVRKYTATEPTYVIGAEQHPRTGDSIIT